MGKSLSIPTTAPVWRTYSKPHIYTTNSFSTVPPSVMQSVVAGSDQSPSGGRADLDVWLFRHNFTQAGFRCSQLGSPREPFALRGEASKGGVPGDTGLVFIDTTVADAGPIDLISARLIVR